MKKRKQPQAAPEPQVVTGDETHRCKLCTDGAVGKPLVVVVDAVRQKAFACRTHVAFYGGTYTGKNRKYLPGNERQAPQVPLEDPDDDGGSAIKMTDREH